MPKIGKGIEKKLMIA
jgi:hypothetical protein